MKLCLYLPRMDAPCLEGGVQRYAVLRFSALLKFLGPCDSSFDEVLAKA